jgi:pimeloyl-ACP methyl ester carboxylesterase
VIKKASALSGQKLVFMPGLDGTGISFEPLGKILPPDLIVKVVQYPTDRLLSFAQTIQCAGEQLQAAQGAIVVAESFSGPVAIALAGTVRLNAKALVLCATFARPPRPRMLKILSCLPLEMLFRLPYPRFIFKHVVEGGAEAADLFHALWQRIRASVPASVLAHRVRMIREMDVRAQLPRLGMPCLYLQAAGDRTVPAEALQDFKLLLPDLRIQRIQGPHFILQARPSACLEVIEDFVGGIKNSGCSR